ncbi:MAG: hypothetical protein J6X02_06000 [Bacilli bacterium]|nr:hypothetical protein [Bacilli bacterium]
MEEQVLLTKLNDRLKQRECSLESLAQVLNVSELEIMGNIRKLKVKGENLNITNR